MTVSAENRPSPFMMSSVNPSAKYACPASPLWSTRGRNAIAGLPPATGLLVRNPRPNQNAAATSRHAKATGTTAATRAPLDALAHQASGRAAPIVGERLGSGRSCGPNIGDIGFKPVAAARNCLDQARPIVAERAPQFADALHQHIVRDGEARPDRRKNLVLRDEATGILHQAFKDGEGFWPKRNFGVVMKKAAAIQIQDVAIKPQPFWRSRRWRFDIAGGHCPARRSNWVSTGVI